MTQGLVHTVKVDGDGTVRVVPEIVPLARLDKPAPNRGLSGGHVQVRNGATLHRNAEPLGVPEATPNASGDFIFRPGRGGPRIHKPDVTEERVARYIEASHFAEVNAYFHLDRIAHYIAGLLAELGAKRLPAVVAVVHAHCEPETCDSPHRFPMQGGHYRLPGAAHDYAEPPNISAAGEIHLGPGRQLLANGALAAWANKPYRHNAGHNAGILYHEYGHHIHRHTADFRANHLRPVDRQSNRKVTLDEAGCDYWAAAMLGTPHIWALHRRHDDAVAHPRSLLSPKTMADFDRTPEADPHANGTIWASALWTLRTSLTAARCDGPRLVDLLILQSLLLIGSHEERDRPATCRWRSRFRNALAMLLEADRRLTAGSFADHIHQAFAAKGIYLSRPEVHT